LILALTPMVSVRVNQFHFQFIKNPA